MNLKMVMISYNEAIDIEAMELLSNLAITNYTKIVGTYGKGQSSGTHLGNDIWPGRNNLLYISCTSPEAAKLVSGIKELRKKLGKEGIKAFILPIEEVT